MQGNVALGSSSRLPRLLFPIFTVLLLFHSTLAHAQVTVKVNDNVSFRIGAQLQLWADELQDPVSKGYAANLFVRRARFLVTGTVAPNVSFFIQTDNPNMGKAPKSLTTGFLIQDAWAEWKLRDEFAISGGLMLVPNSRHELNSTTSFITLDISPTSTVFAGPTQTSGTRDTGFQAKGYIADGRLEYRAGIFQGVRNAAATGSVGSRNSFLHAGYLLYDFFEKERGYTYAGTNLGKRKILSVSGAFNGQNKYKSYNAGVHATIPEVVHYDGKTFLPTLPRQNDYLAEFGYYMAPIKTQPFVKFEDQKFGVKSHPSKDVARYGAGLNYYVMGQNLKFTGQYLRIKPKNGAIRASNEVTVQMQAWYY